MARASTTSDAFNAVAEPRRREILSYLAGAERPVGDIVDALGLEQPSVSKHLRVLRDVGLVRMRCQGRQKLYRTNAEAILTIADKGKGMPDIVSITSGDDLRSLGVGIAGMNARLRQFGGRLEIASSKRGTTVRAIVPRPRHERVEDRQSAAAM